MPTPPCFKSFPRLPPELRWQIWQHAASSPPKRPGVCIAPKDLNQSLTVLETGSLGMLLASKEARKIALKFCVTRKYDPITDILYTHQPRLWRCIHGDNKPPAWVKDVRHLALPLTYLKLRRFRLMTADFKSMERISVVYPNSSKEDHFPLKIAPEAHCSPCKGASLRVIEFLDTRVDRDYMQLIRGIYMRMQPTAITYLVDGIRRRRPGILQPGADRREFGSMENTIFQEETQKIQTREITSIRERLENLEFELNKEVLWHCRGVRSWDIERGGLRLGYAARCFTW